MTRWEGYGADAILPSERYDDLAASARVANDAGASTVRLAVPVGPGAARVDGAGSADAEQADAVLLFNALVPEAAFGLLSALPMRRPARIVLEDNGLSLRSLTLREAALLARRSIAAITGAAGMEDGVERIG